ncbi:hypothetical protein ACFL49_01270 [Candidatus Omnitrophota bacterium]
MIISIKLVLAILLIPVVAASSVGFLHHLTQYPVYYEQNFLFGIGIFLFMYFFIYQFWGFYDLGQKIISNAFKVFAPVDRWLIYVVPFYLTITMLLFYVVDVLLGVKSYGSAFMFFAGFTFAMHVLLSAHSLQEKERTVLKPSYYFLMMVTFILTVGILVLLMGLTHQKFTFIDYAGDVVNRAQSIYMTSIRGLF